MKETGHYLRRAHDVWLFIHEILNEDNEAIKLLVSMLTSTDVSGPGISGTLSNFTDAVRPVFRRKGCKLPTYIAGCMWCRQKIINTFLRRMLMVRNGKRPNLGLSRNSLLAHATPARYEAVYEGTPHTRPAKFNKTVKGSIFRVYLAPFGSLTHLKNKNETLRLELYRSFRPSVCECFARPPSVAEDIWGLSGDV